MNLLTIAGGIVAVGASIAILCLLLFWSVECVRDLLARLEKRGADASIAWQQNKLRSASWWFSEDPPTRNLLADLAELDEWQAREKWRKAKGLPH